MTRVALLFTLLLGAMGCQQPADIDVADARVRAMLPGMDKTAGYMRIANRTDQVKVLVAVSMPGIRAIEIHETTEVDGMMRMRPLTELSLPAGATVTLSPGGRHLMLIGVISLVDDAYPVTFELDDGREVTASFVVDRNLEP